jgi:adenylate cyclase
MSLFSELKRRNVFRVALLYLVASWVIMQVADVGISLLGLPVTTGRLVFLLLAIAFPLVMLFSWAYEITPEGLKKEKEVERTQSVTDQTARKLDTVVIVLLVIAIGGLALDRLVPGAVPESPEASSENPAQVPVPAGAPERSIAVLPFVNMSADKDNEYFSDGLSEELLNLLAKIPDLQVAARTSAFRFKESDASIAEIASQLNVAHVLEGSVRKSGTEIRITAQLINASDGYHLWSNTWDRTLLDVFAIQDEIAAAVVAALKVSLLGELPKVRATDPEAYSLYLRSKEAARKFSHDGLDESISLLTQALAIDPDYAEAWTELGRSHINLVGQGYVNEADGYARASAANERALALDPGNARALSNQGWVAMYWGWDFPKAARLIGRAMELEPGNASIVNTYAVLFFVFGRSADAISLYNEALALDPFAVAVLGNLTGSYLNNDELDDAARLIARIKDVEPESLYVAAMTGWVENGRGNSEAALDYFTVAGDLGPWGLAIAHYDLGQDDASDAALDMLIEDNASPIQVAAVYAYRGQTDDAFVWLEQAFEVRDSWMIEIRMFKRFFSPLHSDPRWEELLERIGITDDVATSIGL